VLLRERCVPTTADTIDENNEDFTIALERLRLLEQSMIMMRSTVATITPASATEGSAVFQFTEQPFCNRVDYTFTFTNGTASADYTTKQLVRLRVLLRELGVPTTADTIAESNETFTIASGTASATGTINDNDAYCSHDRSCFGY
jgi:hypothetical protein